MGCCALLRLLSVWVCFDLVDFSGFVCCGGVFMVVCIQGLVVWIALSFGCLLLLCAWYGVLG